MISDLNRNASIPVASSNAKDLAKKKRANRSAKLKQCKLDARREQWLSQVKTKDGCEKEVNNRRRAPGGPSVHSEIERRRPIEKLEIKPRDDDENYGNGSSTCHYSDSESLPSNSPTSHTSSALGSNHTGTNFTASSRSSSSSSSRSNSISSNGCCSEIMSEDDDGDVGYDGCLDDWEAVADALAATDKKKQEHNLNLALGSPPLEEHGNSAPSSSPTEIINQEIDISNANPKDGGMAVRRPPVNFRAWRADDAFRPQCLPNLSKQHSFPLNSEWRLCRGGSVWGCKNVGPVPTSCPICYEDLDFTDSSFLPCSCGFRLCLFCHKRILEEDGRCPGCRKQYGHDPEEEEATFDGDSLAYKLARSSSMIARS